MGVQKGKNFDITAVIMAVAGGSVANIIMDVSEKKIGVISDNPIIASLIPSLIGTAGIFFLDDKYKPAFYGMLGGAGGDIVDNMNLIQGFSRMNYQIPSEASTPATIQDLAVTEQILEQVASEPSENEQWEEEQEF